MTTSTVLIPGRLARILLRQDDPVFWRDFLHEDALATLV